MFSVHQLSLKSVEEKCENTAECCLQKTKKQQQQKNKTNKQKKKTAVGKVYSDQNVALSRVTDLQICLETTAQ